MFRSINHLLRHVSRSVASLAMLLLLAASQQAQEKIGPTAILGAMGEEVALIESRLSDKQERQVQGMTFFTGKLNGRPVVLARSGIGKVNAAVTTILLIEHFNPSEVIFTGIAGAINPELFPGDVVIAVSTAQHDYGANLADRFEHRGAPNPADGRRNPVFIPADARLLDAAERASRSVQFDKIKIDGEERAPRVIKGVVVTGDSFISSASKKAELRKLLEADAVEMEGAAVAQVCWQQSVPCLIIRSISDRADSNALRDIVNFQRIAARNSARLVAALLDQLESARQ
ncbi:MAG: 5'-methylthioadenosine/adenosylhomocysteine nucleosidase [Acidobacteriota bacterium]